MTVEPDQRRLARKRATARAVLWFEQLWPAVWPALGVLGAYACLALLDVPAMLPAWPRLLLLIAVVLAAAALLWRGLSRVVRPTDATADRRLERATGLKHRPLATLSDRLDAPTPEASALWQVHLARLAAQIPRLRVGRPRPGLAARDGWALRGGLLVALVACFVVAGPETFPRLARAVTPVFPSGPAAPGTQVQAWVTPPAYTGLPPVLLQTAVRAVSVPAGSHLTVSLTGGSGQPELSVNDASDKFNAIDASSWQAERDLNASGRVVVARGGNTVAAWNLTLIPDQPPSIAFIGKPGQAVVGGRPTLQTRLAWQASDDYGVAGVQAELRLRDRPDAPPLVVPSPLTGSPKTIRGVTVQNLTAHPWAGLPVIGRMVARDTPGQTGTSAAEEFILPERPFQNPVARALIAIRRQLSLTPDARRDARLAIDTLADAPETYDNNLGIMLNLRAVAALLARGRDPDTVDQAQARMWELALALEEGATDRTARALQQARQALKDAIEKNQDTPADKAEIDRRVQELRDAIQKHIEALAEQARRDGTEMPLDPNVPQLNARDLDRLAQQLQKSLDEGRKEDAQREEAELEQLLEQLQNARPEHGQSQEKQNAQRRQRGRQQTDAVQDMVQREGQLLDRSHGRQAVTIPPPPSLPSLQQQFAQQFGQRPLQSPPQPESSQQQPASPQDQQQQGHDTKSQQAMRRALGELMQRFGDLTGQVPAPLSDADQAMRDAGQALAQGHDSAASADEQRAIEALQKGGREMGQQIARQFGTGQPQDGDDQDGQDGQSGQGYDDSQNRDRMTTGPQPGDQTSPGQRRSARRDPLGRPLREGTSGADESGSTAVPDSMEQARTRDIQEELRRRDADRTRPQSELDYIGRLLKSY